jgi:hypothetical protein
MGPSWIYVAGPILGAMIAVGFEWILKGKPAAAVASAAQGTGHVPMPGEGNVVKTIGAPPTSV